MCLESDYVLPLCCLLFFSPLSFSASDHSHSSVSETVPPGWRQELGLLGPLSARGRRSSAGAPADAELGGRGGRRISGAGSGWNPDDAEAIFTWCEATRVPSFLSICHDLDRVSFDLCFHFRTFKHSKKGVVKTTQYGKKIGWLYSLVSSIS